jgi:DNA polymerase (family X)
MTNKEIAGLFKLTASLLELHEENQFKIRVYTNAVFNIEKQDVPLIAKSREELERLDGIGKGLAQSIIEINEKGSFELLDTLLSETPDGVIEMMKLKGIGPKKIKALWKELDIENIDQLYEACSLGKLASLKGFGEKTQESILLNLEFLISQRGKVLFAEAELYAEKMISTLRNILPDNKIELTGDMRRKVETLEQIDILIDTPKSTAVFKVLILDNSVNIDRKLSGPYSIKGTYSAIDLKWQIRFVAESEFFNKLMLLTGSDSHLSQITEGGISLHQYLLENRIESEKAAYAHFSMPYIEPELREGTFETAFTMDNTPPKLLELSDLKGPIHNHSTYSDGQNTLRQLAEYCINQGYEYLGISDHSKSAFYANGLQEHQIKQQHIEIDEINKELAPFKILKGIESDILNDGSLDYEPAVLVKFDFIVASIHSNLNMDRNKATLRLLKAVENPYTTILGHPTGRLLLRRQGYPVYHEKIIDACAEHGVIIEINANPWRLDLDWRLVHYALEKGVILSINPDAHELAGFSDMQYGVHMGRKGGLTKEKTFNTWSLTEVEQYLAKRKIELG